MSTTSCPPNIPKIPEDFLVSYAEFFDVLIQMDLLSREKSKQQPQDQTA